MFLIYADYSLESDAVHIHWTHDVESRLAWFFLFSLHLNHTLLVTVTIKSLDNITQYQDRIVLQSAERKHIKTL